MIKKWSQSQGFTAVELLVTLFVAGAFLIAGFQLFGVVIKDGGDARAKSRASNVAYQYVREYADSATFPCTTVTPLTNQPVTIEGLTAVTATVIVSCSQPDAPSLSKIDVTIRYGQPQQTLTYATYVDKSKGATVSNEIVNGVAGGWFLNGNGLKAAGPHDATLLGTTPTVNRSGAANQALSLDGVTSDVSVPYSSSFTSTPLSASIWVYPRSWVHPTATMFLSTRTSANNGWTIGYLNASSSFFADCGGLASRYIPGFTPTLNAWTHIVVSCAPSSVSVYVNGGTTPGATYTRASNNMTATITESPLGIGSDPTSNYKLDGNLDDARIYNRILSASEAKQLYDRGPQ